ncbi:hypothetical protein NBH19_18880 [Rhizobium sp. S95]|uniref:Uncharacterized protein n=1 Tax=Ciceribacter sichuanensis TaxID=2949647 RepID=A0AAJ1C0E0_9HYPH|nr:MULTISPECIES: hypothetical protein [unclassified Ciceribacter]MCM2398138.1 hypothetical protein [Ciceribacter sp. S95]MCO5959489.1 hypothetical protein [Ciceribacter sp. S101]
MKRQGNEEKQQYRDGKESLAEPVDLEECSPADIKKRHDDGNLDEALRETFPASDPPASGRFE